MFSRCERPMPVSKRVLGSDLAKVDAHEIRPREYEEIPEIDEAFMARARKPGPTRRKEAISIRLDIDLVERLRATGEGWQSRANDALRAWVDKTVA